MERSDRLQTENMQNTFRRGIMSLVVLSLLKKEDMYGYQLVTEAEKQSGGRIITQEGSLYPVLYKLVDQGFISDRREKVGKRMTRVYYHLEPAGEQRLAELMREYEAVTQGVYQIMKGSEWDVEGNTCQMVSVENQERASGKQEAEEGNSLQSGIIRPGLCF